MRFVFRVWARVDATFGRWPCCQTSVRTVREARAHARHATLCPEPRRDGTETNCALHEIIGYICLIYGQMCLSLCPALVLLPGDLGDVMKLGGSVQADKKKLSRFSAPRDLNLPDSVKSCPVTQIFNDKFRQDTLVIEDKLLGVSFLLRFLSTNTSWLQWKQWSHFQLTNCDGGGGGSEVVSVPAAPR
ncbi:hypothetical protein BaRGS_00007912 [Batillaria attramentaria]|uniref:Uncharacterized protein n=1 Tax=Batillaria attramentaria TaxID=370345 RepID=A0ABD0LN60_9CAEN